MNCACGCGAPVWRWRLSERCAHLLAGMCAGKTRWLLQQHAEQRRHRGQESYRCKVCDHWHNGSIYGATAQIRQQQDVVIAGLRRHGYPLGQLAAGFGGMDRIKWKHRGEITS